MTSNRIGDIDGLDGYEFELLVMRLLKEMGLEVEETKKSGDGGIDVLARSEEPITGGLFVVQCKRYSSNVGEPQVRDLYGVVNHTNASKGILITNSAFTQQARRFAEGKPIELIDGERLKDLLVRYRIEGDVPKGKGILVIPKPYKRFYRKLSSIVEKIQTKLEIG
jgi:restriction system protein